MNIAQKTSLLFACALFATPMAVAAQTGGMGQGQGQGQGQGMRMNLDERFAAMDTNKDGAITREEFKGPRPENFDKMDANKDGKLTREEMSEYMKARMAERQQGGGKKPDAQSSQTSSSQSQSSN